MGPTREELDVATITAIAPWFGSKRTLAPKIVEELGPHRVYWSLFAGSLAVEMVKPPCVMETVCELHGDATNLARVLANAETAHELYRAIRWAVLSEAAFEDAAKRIQDQYESEELSVSRAADFLYTTWMGRNGVAGTASYNHNFCVRYTSNGGHAAKRWDGVRRSLLSWHRRLRNITILRRDAFKVTPRIEDKPRTAIYADPPYVRHSTSSGFGRRKGSSLYVHDFTEEQHRELAVLLGRFTQARVVVSYYDHPLIRELYADWTWRHLDVSKALAHQGRRGKNDTRAPEVLLLNGPSHAKEKLLF